MNKPVAAPEQLVDADQLKQQLIDCAAGKGGGAAEARADLLAILKQTSEKGRKAADKFLQADGHGTLCARRLSNLQDAIITAIHDFALEQVFPTPNRSSAERLGVVAVGGYGRGTLAPGSDIDLLFLLPYKQTPWGESVVEYILYMLWDMGFKVGHATRSVPECIRQSRLDMTIRTSVLEARYLCGDRELYDTLTQRFDAEIVKNTGPEFINAKLAERDDRHLKQGATRYLVEPNVKDGKGGLRDLHTLFWIAKYLYRTGSRDAMVEAGLFSKAELRRFRKCEDFLWAVRCNLHFMTGHAEERLSFDLQRDMAVRLGYTAHPGLRDVERFMKHYFLVAKDVGDLTRIFCAALEEHHGKQTPVLNRFLQLGRRRKRTISGTTDFIVDHDRINVADEDVFRRDPVNLIRMFHLAGRHELAFHPDAMQLVSRSLKLIDGSLRDDPEANRLFLEILTSRKQPETVLRRMNETGVLGRFVPDFGKIVSMMQFNMYHHYTVDEHLLQAIGILARIDRGDSEDDHSLATEVIRDVDRDVLYVTLLLHDIAKGRPEDHSLAGARVARRLAPRFGLTPAQTATVVWLVQEHLTMSKVAQSRDLNDPKTIADFAAVVQSRDRLELLYVLTVADITAVGPGVWNGWKAQLLRTLYYETESNLSGGHSQASRQARVAAAKEELATALADWPEKERTAYLKLHYPAYWLRVDLERKYGHAHFIRETDEAGKELATSVNLKVNADISELTVLAPDHPRLLSVIAGACTVAGANIVDAQIYTTTDGRALDSVTISRAFSTDEDEIRRAGKIGSLIEQVLLGETQLPEIVASRARSKGKLRAFSVETRVAVDNDWSDYYTAIEASGLDRTGLLYDLTRALSDLNLNIASAQIVTFGERAVDVFYVTDLVGQKITNGNRIAAVRRRLTQAFDGEDAASAERQPRRRAAG